MSGSHRVRCGQATIMMSLSLVSTMGVLGLVVDLGFEYWRRLECQTAAQSAAIAGAMAAKNRASLTCGTNSSTVPCQSATACSASLSTPTTDPVTAACLYAKQNGFTSAGRQTVTIAANLSSQTASPVTGVSPTYWIRATVTESIAQTFSAVLGKTSAMVSAEATAGVFQTGGGGCVYVLDASATKSLWQTGSGDLESACGVWVNSSDTKAIYQTAGAVINTHTAYTNLVGGYYQTGSATITPLPVAASAAADPLAGKTLPTLPTPVVCTYTNFSSSGNATVYPGTYCGGLSITGSGTTTFSSGLYIMDGGGFNIAGSGNASGTGMTVLLTSDAGHSYKGLSINGSGTYNFSAPTSGPNEAMLFIGDRTTASSLGSTITGTTTAQFNGVIYLPKEALTYTGGSNLTAYTIIVCDTLKMTGLSYVESNYGSLASGNPIGGVKHVSLIE